MPIINHHGARLESEIKKLTASFLATRGDKRSLITVTDFSLSSDHQRGYINISVLPNQEAVAALAFANRQMNELVAYLYQHLKIKTLPRLSFRLEKGDQAG